MKKANWVGVGCVFSVTTPVADLSETYLSPNQTLIWLSPVRLGGTPIGE
jgi:hypothetical protein